MLRLWNLSVLLQYNSSLFENNRQHLCYLRNIHATIARVCRQGYCWSSFFFVFPASGGHFSWRMSFFGIIKVFLRQPLSNKSLVITIFVQFEVIKVQCFGGFHYHAIKNKKELNRSMNKVENQREKKGDTCKCSSQFSAECSSLRMRYLDKFFTQICRVLYKDNNNIFYINTISLQCSWCGHA